MRLRFRDFDHLSKARAAASVPFFLFSNGEEMMEDEESFQSRWFRGDVMSSPVNVSALSPIERLSFARAHTQFLSSIFPQNYEESRPKCGEKQQQTGKDCAIFQVEPPEMKLSQVSDCAVFQVELPEMELSQVGDFSIFQLESPEMELALVSHFSIFQVEPSEMELSQVSDLSNFQVQPPEMELSQVIFKMMKDNGLSLNPCSSPASIEKDLESTIKCKDSTCIDKEKENMNNLVLQRISPGQVESSTFLKCVGSPFQFEVYEVGLDNYDLQTVREALLLVDPDDQLNHFEQQSSTIWDYPELSCSMHPDLFSYFNREDSLNHISEEHLKFSPTYKRIQYETEISAAHLISSGENNITMKWEFATAAQIHIFEVLELFGGKHLQTFEYFKDLMDAIQVTFEESTDPYVKSESSFHELLVVPELNLTDNTFKSLPTPFFDDKEVLISLSIIKMLCNQYNPHRASASDYLYLDWHQSKGGACNNCNCSSIQKKIEDEGNCSLTNLRIPYVTMTTGVFSTIEYFEQSQDNYPPNVVTELPESVSLSGSAGVKSATVTNGEQDICDLNTESGQQNTFQSSSKDYSLFSSMPVSSDLSFFLNARRGSIRYGDPLAKKIGDSKSSSFLDNCKPRSKSELLSNDDVQKNRLQMHHVEIPKSVLEIFDSLQAKFESVLALDHDLKRVVDTFPDTNKLCIINSSQAHLMSLIKNSASKKDSLDSDSVLRGLVTMHVLHKTAFYICFYGIRVAHLYMKKLVQSIYFLEDSVQPLYTFLKDAFHKSENGLIEEHPMISSLEQILKSDLSPQCDYKILLVAERKSFVALQKKVTAMNLKLHEFVWTDKLSNQWPDCREKSQLNQAVLDALAQCDCLIVSHRNINTSFPFEQFKSIVEYDDSHLSSQISCIIGRIAHTRNIHLIRVEFRGNMISSLFTETLTNLTNSITKEVILFCTNV
ncbi:protein SHORTAGE IN CHIASMATA 1 homolog [Cryptomeria japonica]|uniref:protein SHORTAGE IN CHIASMATA 1 homolog n=1 Tax=Cryptomeria japonica TaxID=3369 RepID=UPI0027DA9B6A|nr:protein SHORTAGE IN CHIASMATA 1 homolog [Cryptomeria japonica]